MLSWLKNLGMPTEEELEESARAFRKAFPKGRRKSRRRRVRRSLDRGELLRRGLPPLLPPTGEERDDN